MSAAAVLFLLPIPYFIFGPGKAVDLNTAVIVPGRRPPLGRLFLTDITMLPGRPAYYAMAKVVPGFEIIRRERYAPPSVSDAQLNARLVDAMRESQLSAQIVAERAAGLPVQASHAFLVVRPIPHTPGARCFHAGDEIVALDNRAFRHPTALADAARSRPVGARFTFTLHRGNATFTLACTTAIMQGKRRFGILIETKTEHYRLPVRVEYRVANINGSSAGLMFALQIYRTLTSQMLARGQSVAGTGVLGFDGSVSEIGGAPEKVRSAQRAGATIFLVPKGNYRDVQSTPGIRVVPVSSFAAALKALQNM